jgi:ribosome biogenesis protein ENP2
MEVQDRNGVKVYSLCTGRPLPSWLGERARRNLAKRDSGVRERIELLQDFEFDASSSCIRQSPNGEYIAATGTYRPSLKMYNVSDLGMKFERRLDSEALDFMFLSEDFGKLAILCVDRTLEFHAPYGSHHKLRIPTFGRKLAYEQSTSTIMCTSSGGGVYRVNLEEGRHSEPLTEPPKSVGTTAITVSPTHRLTAVGSEDGNVRFYDNRISGDAGCSSVDSFCTIDVASAVAGYGFHDSALSKGTEISSATFSSNGINVAIGTSTGCVALYDVRSSRPLHIKEHQYGLPIHTVLFHDAANCVMSGDKKIIKAWRYDGSTDGGFNSNNGGLFGGGDGDDDDELFGSSSKASKEDNKAMGSIVCNIEAEGDFNHFIISKDAKNPTGNNSGLVLCAGEQSRCQAYYAPDLGTAPRWCSFLDNITEELEERKLSEEPGSASNNDAVYEDYKFLSKEEVTSLGIDNLVGTPLLRGYMHGFFISSDLYSKVKSVANPFEYEEYRKKKIREKIEAKTESKITPRVKKVVGAGVNKDLAERLAEKAGTNKGKKAAKAAGSLLEDSRFGGLFENPDFDINQDSQEFKLRNPSGVAARKFGNEDDDMDSDRDDNGSDDEGGVAEDEDMAGFSKIGDTWGDEDSGDDSGGDDASDNDSENEDGFLKAKVRGDRYEAMKKLEKAEKKEKKATKAKRQKKTMFEASNYDGDSSNIMAALGDDKAAKEMAKKEREAEMGLGERVRLNREEEAAGAVKKTTNGTVKGVVREYTYTPKKRGKAGEEEAPKDEGSSKKRERRGVKELKLKR